MKIKRYKDMPITYFKDLKKGDVFECEGGIFMVIKVSPLSSIPEEYASECNCICLKTGTICHCDDDVLVNHYPDAILYMERKGE